MPHDDIVHLAIINLKYSVYAVDRDEDEAIRLACEAVAKESRRRHSFVARIDADEVVDYYGVNVVAVPIGGAVFA